MTRPLVLAFALLAALAACKPTEPPGGGGRGGGAGGGGGGKGGGGGGGGGGGRNRPAEASSAATATRTAGAPDGVFTTSGPGGQRGSHKGGGTGLGTGGGDTAKQEAATEVHGQRRQRPSAVYLDGAPLAAISYGELPPALTATWVTFEGGNKVRRFSVTQYLAALGIDVAKIKAAHFHSGRKRVGILTGDQLRAAPDTAMFSFTQDTGGKTRMHFSPTSGITTSIDRLWTLAVYVDKDPPVVDPTTHALMLGGQPLKDLAYVTTPIGGGVRIYVDGRLEGYVKRSSLSQTKTSSTSGPVPFSVADVLTAQGIDLGTIKSVELVGDDKVVSRPPAKGLRTLQALLVEHSSGYMRLPTGEEANVMLLYAKAKAPDPKLR